MQVCDINILDLLPQKPPFVMVDRMIEFDNSFAKTSFTVKPDGMFCENGFLSEEGVVENIAQTCAARMGYISRNLEGGSVKLGFIGAIRNMDILRRPKTGEEIITEINVVEEVFSMTLVNVAVKIDTEIIAAGEMKISITDIDKADE